jgi:MFS family permease
MNLMKKWTPLFATNFLGVLNNNYLRWVIVFLSIRIFQQDKELMTTIAAGLYVVSYIFFSPLGGRLAKTRRKSDVMFWSKCAELIVFVLACISFTIHNIYIGLFCVFAVGLISTLFSPSKYGLIRDIGGDKGISFGTGTLEMFTFLGVLIGTFVASVLSDHYSFWLLAVTLIGFSLMQLVTSRMLGKVQETQTIEVKNDTLNPLTFVIQSFKWAKTITHSNIIVLGLATFWMIGNFVLMNLTVHCDKVLHMTNTQTGILMDISGLGIGIGSMLTGLWSRKKVQLGFTPIGAVGMILCFIILYFFRPTGIFFSSMIFFASFFCGMYMVPLSSWVQHSVEGRLQGDMLAYSNFVIFLLIFISAGIFGPFVKIFDTNALWLLLLGIVLVMQIVLLINVKEMGSKMMGLFKKEGAPN